MTGLILKIYDYFRRHRVTCWLAFAVSTVVLVLALTGLGYDEDISAFLPLDGKNKTALEVYQDVSGANNLYALVGMRDTTGRVDAEVLAEGIELFCDKVEASDTLGYLSGVTKQVDMETMWEVMDFVYGQIPLFMTEEDYERIDSLLSDEEFVAGKLEEDKEMLLFPSTGIVAQNLGRDPLGLFTPVFTRLQGEGGACFESYDGYILTPDGKRGIVIMTSANGANESDRNARLIDMLESAKSAAEGEMGELDIHIVGGPAIAVSNARRIKHDSMLAVILAGVMILGLLVYVFRNVRNILLIAVSVGWGWLFAMGGIALMYDGVSIIVIGIASVILGIAVNYPLHLIDHLKDSSRPRFALREIITPLVVGNVTTVGAFLCLVPLNAPALHDLGLFASMLLVGTIFFVLIFLPHAVRTRRPGSEVSDPRLISLISGYSLENNRWLVWVTVLLTVVFGYYALGTEFDSDIRNVNYMTAEQRADMDYFAGLMSHDAGREKVYVVSSGADWDEALRRNELIDREIDEIVSAGWGRRGNDVSEFVKSRDAQGERLSRWGDFLEKYGGRLKREVEAGSVGAGFSPGAFEGFYDLLDGEYGKLDFSELGLLTDGLFRSNFSSDDEKGRHSVVQVIEVDPGMTGEAKSRLEGLEGYDGQAFDVRSMNGSIAESLSDDFNYIGLACGCMVFFFLWISLGNVELATVSFLPMALSWVWILGIMGMLDLKFNIVNVILATFIFGQGDDYTIFMTEGLSYEFAYRRKVLRSYKNSIVVSALIMFIGIGTLVISKHPALRSLGEVTVVGMASVVMMAYLFPPLVFNWLVKKGGKVRYRPVTIGKVLSTWFCGAVFLVQLGVGYLIGFFLLKASRPTAWKRLFLHRYTCSVFRWDVKRMPGMRFRLVRDAGADLERPSVIVCNHQSMLDPFYLMTLSPKVVVVANDHVGRNVITGRMFRWLDCITVGEGIEGMIEKLRPLVAEGYSVAIFPEGERPTNVSNRVKRFHKGAFQFAEALGLDVVPVYLHGLVQAMPKGSALTNGGEVVMEVGRPITPSELGCFGDDVREVTQGFRRWYQEYFTELCRRQSTVKNVSGVVFDKYLYKGGDVERAARRNLKRISGMSEELEKLESEGGIYVKDEKGQGELALLLGLMYPGRQVTVYLPDADRRALLRGCLVDFIDNVCVVDEEELFLEAQGSRKRGDFFVTKTPSHKNC